PLRALFTSYLHDAAPNVQHTLSLHDALPIFQNFGLELGPVSEEVSVTAAAPLMNRTTAEISTVIESKTLTEIPLNGRNFLQLNRSEEHTSEPSHVSISYAVFCLKKKTTKPQA